jgi:L-aspartate oxidase
MTERGYIVSPKINIGELDDQSYDVIIVGAGIAGMTAALSLDHKLKVALVSKQHIKESSTYKAQGGMAISLGADDSLEEHIADTLRVGRGLCHEPAVTATIREAPAALEFLQSLGAHFNQGEDGLYLGKEAGHSHHRIVHYYDSTGRHIAETMAKQIQMRKNITWLDHCFLVDLLTKNNQCYGCMVLHSGRLVTLRAHAVVIATGGYSGLFARSTNSVSANGDGIAAAYRAGAALADMEFVQFHPTSFTTLSGEVFLLTEALRGEGAMLRNAAGERFMFSYHADGELAPRDEVARAIVTELQSRDQGVVYLDARHLGKGFLMDRFRQVSGELLQNGYHVEKDLIPIAPAAHYTIGGIATNLWGQTTLSHLFACGEAAATGVHGANRLASNSLLEGVVFGRRVAQVMNQDFPAAPLPSSKEGAIQGAAVCYGGDTEQLGLMLDRVAGVVRKGQSMSALLMELQHKVAEPGSHVASIRQYHQYNACQLAELILKAALLRCESRGTHYREDYPEKRDADFSKHVVQQWRKGSALHEYASVG